MGIQFTLGTAEFHDTFYQAGLLDANPSTLEARLKARCVLYEILYIDLDSRIYIVVVEPMEIVESSVKILKP